MTEPPPPMRGPGASRRAIEAAKTACREAVVDARRRHQETEK